MTAVGVANLDDDTVRLIMSKMSLDDGLGAASICQAWKEMSRSVWGSAKLLGDSSLLYDGQRDLCSTKRFVCPEKMALLPNGDICVVDSYYCDPHRRATIVSPAFVHKRHLPCPEPRGYPETDWCPGEGRLEAAVCTDDILFLSYYFPGCPGSCGRLFKYRLSDLALLAQLESNYRVGGLAEADDDDDDQEWAQYFCVPVSLLVLDGKLYVCDAGGECGEPSVVVFDMDLKYLFTFGVCNDYHLAEALGGPVAVDSLGLSLISPSDIACHEGLIYVCESQMKCIYVFDPAGNFQRVVLCNGSRFTALGEPIRIEFARGRLLVATDVAAPTYTSNHSGLVLALTPHGVLLQKIKLESVPYGLFAHEAEGRVYVACHVPATPDARPHAIGHAPPVFKVHALSIL